MHSYRNLIYDYKTQEIVLFTWSNEGERIQERHQYKPYCYIEDASGKDAVSIYNTNLKKLEFNTPKKRREFCEITKRNFYNLQIEQQFLIDNFKNQNKNKDFSLWPLKTYFIDIETYSPNGFPTPSKAEDPIMLISVYDTIFECVYTFGVGKEYFTKDDKVIYKAYETEEEMLKAFIRFWRKDPPDIVSGWYSWGFDLPYICNRINKIYNEDDACNRLSPVGNVFKQENVKKRLGGTERIYDEMWTIQ
ncbi:MAG: 3'-5' exonuclease, partial [Candidatus Omnitrophota bacterium]